MVGNKMKITSCEDIDLENDASGCEEINFQNPIDDMFIFKRDYPEVSMIIDLLLE